MTLDSNFSGIPSQGKIGMVDWKSSTEIKKYIQGDGLGRMIGCGTKRK